MSKHKQELRKEMRLVLKNLDPRWVKAASQELCLNLNSLINKQIRRPVRAILAWTSFFPGEPDLSPFIFDQADGREVFLPRCLEDRSMNFIAIGRDWGAQSETGPGGVPQPKDSAGSPYDKSLASETMVLVPGLAFDHEGNRLGRGNGYYDRFLSTANMARAHKIGVCWQLQLVDGGVPTETYDRSVDWIVTEEGVLRTSFAAPEEEEI